MGNPPEMMDKNDETKREYGRRVKQKLEASRKTAGQEGKTRGGGRSAKGKRKSNGGTESSQTNRQRDRHTRKATWNPLDNGVRR